MNNQNLLIMSLTIQNIHDILAKEFKIAIFNYDTVRYNPNISDEIKDSMYNKYLIAKNRWQCLFQVHGCLIANTIWEAPFLEYTEKKQYNSVEDCLKLAKSYNKYY